MAVNLRVNVKILTVRMTILVEQSFTWLWEIKGAIIIRWHYLQFHTQA